MLKQWLGSYLREWFWWSLVMAALAIALDLALRGKAHALATAPDTLLGLVGGGALGHLLLWSTRRRRQGQDRQTV